MIEQILSQRKEKVCRKLLEIFEVLSLSPNLAYYSANQVKAENNLGQVILLIDEQNIATTASDISDTIFTEVSQLTDNFITIENLKLLIKNLLSAGTIERLNHVGFCYRVQLQEKELERIKSSVKKTSFHLYEMQSNDLAKWYFVGDTTNWQDPLIEFLPCPQIYDKYTPLWLPHIQIDIDTNLPAAEIERLIKEIFGNTGTPLRIGDRKNTYSVRLRLGITSGININLDISTSARQSEYSRRYLLKVLL